MDAPYSNREQDTQHKVLVEYLKRIETQTMKTNGRVSKLEQWRWLITGAIIVIGFLLANNYIHFIK